MARDPRDQKIGRVESRRGAKIERMQPEAPSVRKPPTKGRPQVQQQKPAKADQVRKPGAIERFVGQIARRL